MKDMEFELNEKLDEINELSEENKILKERLNIKEEKEETIYGFQLVNSSVHYTNEAICYDEEILYVDEYTLVDGKWVSIGEININTKYIMLMWKVSKRGM